MPPVNRRRSASLARQWTFYIVLSLVPLLVTLGYAGWLLNEQTRTYAALVERGLSLNALGVLITREVRELERTARQYQVVREAALYEVFERRYRPLMERLATLEDEPDDRLADSARQLRTLMTRLADTMVQNDSLDESLGQGFTEANRLAVGIYQTIEAVVAERLRVLEAETARQTRLVFLVVGGLLVATLIGLRVVTQLISRPIAQMSEQIARLGAGDFAAAPRIEGATDFVRLGEQLETMRQQLVAASTQKDQFLSHITHELKTPLASIVEASALLGDEVPGPLTLSQQKVVGILGKNGLHLRDMIDQLLNFNSVALAGAKVWEPIDIAAFMHEQVDYFQSLRQTEAVNLSAAGPPLQVQCNRLQLEMLVRNLMTNAIQFSPPNKTVTVSWSASQTTWSICVEDEGPGIAIDDQHHIFDAFYQGKNPRKGAVRGSGIGLAIVKRCADALSAKVTVDSAPGQGSRFNVSFTQAANQQPAEAATEAKTVTP